MPEPVLTKLLGATGSALRVRRVMPEDDGSVCNSAPVTAHGTLTHLSRWQRARVVGISVLRMIITVAAILLVYAETPRVTSGKALLDGLNTLVIALVVFAVAFAWQITRIRKSHHPSLRAAEAAVSTLAIFLVAFSVVYLSYSAAVPGSFTDPLNHVSAFYFTTTVFATVGFGDITPVADTMRIVTTIQMLLDLVFLGVLLRLLVQVAQSATAKRSEPDPEAPTIGP